jgi:protein TonB
MEGQRTKGPDEKFCRSCGAIIKKAAEICPHCGVRQVRQKNVLNVPMILGIVGAILGIVGAAPVIISMVLSGHPVFQGVVFYKIIPSLIGLAGGILVKKAKVFAGITMLTAGLGTILLHLQIWQNIWQHIRWQVIIWDMTSIIACLLFIAGAIVCFIKKEKEPTERSKTAFIIAIALSAVFVIYVAAMFWRQNKQAEEMAIANPTAYASSYLPTQGGYPAKYLTDNTYHTWIEGVDGDGIGESFTLVFDTSVTLNGFFFKNGFGLLAYYYKNNRVKTLEVLADDNTSGEIIEITDSQNFENYHFNKSVKCKRITFKIKSVYKGSVWEDTCISEIRVYNSPDDVNLNSFDGAKMEDVNTNKISGDGTDPDGYLFSFNGDKPPSAIIDFDLRRYYPPEAKSANVLEYTVTVLVQVDEKGKLMGASIASGQAMYGFNEAALKVVNRARFYPGYKDGKPVRMAHHLAIRFVLEN